MSAPKRIYLQWKEYYNGSNPNTCEGVTWCLDEVNESDTEYVKVPQWTPVSEGLLEKETTDLGEGYLVTIELFGGYEAVIECEYFSGQWWGKGNLSREWTEKVTAWMRMPKPYREPE